MRINDYSLIDPQGSDAGTRLEALARAHPLRATRLVQCLEDFVRADTDLACRLVEGGIEIYLVPPRYVLAHVPDSAALVRVDHQHRQIDIVAVVDEYGGYQEQDQWEDLMRLAEELCGLDRW